MPAPSVNVRDLILRDMLFSPLYVLMTACGPRLDRMLFQARIDGANFEMRRMTR
jgi:hypothetical protein